MTETSFTPREIVSELDRYIVGQQDAKRSVAIALRNRWRRQQLDAAMREEGLPKNIPVSSHTLKDPTFTGFLKSKGIQPPKA